MAHNEHRVEHLNVGTITLAQEINDGILVSGVKGRLKMSGVKLYIDTGTSWSLVTSA